MRTTNFILTFLLVLCVGTASETQAQDAPIARDLPATRIRHWTSNWSFESINLKDLTRRLGIFGIIIPVELEGVASIDFDVSIPLNALRTPEAYKFRGTFSATDLRVDDLFLRSLRADVVYEDGVLTLQQMRGEQAEGKFAASAMAELIPRRNFEATIEATEFDVTPITKLLQKFEVIPANRPIQGILSFSAEASGEVDQLGSPESWNATGDALAENVRFGDSFQYTLAIEKFELQDRRIAIPNFRMTASELPDFYLDGSLDVPLDGRESFRFALETNDLPATDLVGLFFDSPERLVDGKLDLRASGQGNFPGPGESLDFVVDLSVASPSLRVAGVDLGLIEHSVSITPQRLEVQPLRVDSVNDQLDLRVKRISADYELSETDFSLRNLEAEVFGGTLDGTARLVRRGNGRHSLQVDWVDITPQFRWTPPALATPLNVVAQTSGSIDWSVPADKIERPFFHEGTANVRVDSIRIGEEPIGDAEIKLAIGNQSVDVDVQANLFGGQVRIVTVAPLTSSSLWKDLPSKLSAAQFTFAEVELRRLLSLVTRGSTRFDGRLSGQMAIRLASGGVLVTESDLTLTSWSSSNRLVARQLSAELVTTGLDIEMVSLSGSYAGGQLQATGRWSLGSGPKLINFRLTRASADRVLLPVSPLADQWLGGLVSGRGTMVGQRGSLSAVRINGSVSVANGTGFGFPLGDAHSSFNGQFSAEPLSWSVCFPAISAGLARGRLKGSLNLASSSSGRSGFHMQSDWRVNHVDFEDLLSTYIGTSTIGRGDLTGDLSLSGRDITSSRDLRGRYRVRLGGTDATAVPGLSAAGSLLGVTSLVGTRFTAGESKGQIFRGNLLIDSMTLTADQLAVTANGRVNLSNRQMDILTVLSTGNFQGQNQLLQVSVSQLLLDQVPLSQINRIVSDRTLVFKMVGPTRDPIIRLLPAETVQANVRRFAVQEAMGLVVADSLFND